MVDQIQFPERTCPQCGIGISQSAPVRCWLCLSRLDNSVPSRGTSEVQPTPLPPPLAVPLPPASVYPPPGRHVPPPLSPLEPEHFQFSLSTLMLAMTLITVLMGVYVTAPGLGVLLGFMSFLAWALASESLKVEAKTKNPTMGRKIQQFLLKLGFVFLVGTASIVAMVASLAAMCYGMIAIEESREGGTTLSFWIILIIAVNILFALVVIAIDSLTKKKPPGMK
jgi:hypothetical protein